MGTGEGGCGEGSGGGGMRTEGSAERKFSGGRGGILENEEGWGEIGIEVELGDV